MYKSSSYSTEYQLRAQYNEQSVNAVGRKNFRFFWELWQTREHTSRAESEDLTVKQVMRRLAVGR